MTKEKRLLGALELNRIYQMDCIEGMRLLPDDSVDLIVIDPPYNIGKDKRWDKWRSVEDYVAWMTEVFRECERVLKPNGSFYWFHNDFEQIVELHRAIKENTSFVFKQFIVWNKRFEGARNKGFLDGFVAAEGLRNYQQMAEYCLFYISNSFQKKLTESRKSLGMTENDVELYIGRVEKKNPNRGTRICRRWEEGSSFPSESDYEKLRNLFGWKESYDEINTVFNNQKTHHSVWNYEVAPKIGHITPKPVELIENIIRHSSNEGAIVLDCFMGSGTTAVAATRLGRNFIGFEREPEYVKIANQRLEMEALSDKEANQ